MSSENRDLVRAAVEAFNRRDVEPGIAVSAHRVRARGKTSGIELEMVYGYLWTFRAGKVVHLKSFATPEAAMAAAGLAE